MSNRTRNCDAWLALIVALSTLLLGAFTDASPLFNLTLLAKSNAVCLDGSEGTSFPADLHDALGQAVSNFRGVPTITGS